MGLKKTSTILVIALFLIAFIPSSEIPLVYAFDSIDTNMRIFWTSEISGGVGTPQLPTGWVRDDYFEDYFLMGIDNDPNTIGGNSFHNHSMDNHTHNGGGSHTHDFTGSSVSGTSNTIETSVRPSAKVAVGFPHSHVAKTSTAGTMDTENDGSYLIENGASSPPFVKVYILKPIDGNQEIPLNASVLNFDSTIPDGYHFNTTFHDTFLLMTNETSDIIGQGGSSSHGHGFDDHDHDLKQHDHADFSGGSSTPTHNAKNPTTFPAPTTPNTVHHTVAVDQEDAGRSTNQTVIVSLASSLPNYIYMGFMTKNDSSQTIPINLTIPYVGNRTSIPNGWELVNETYERFILLTNDTDDIGNLGGESLHSHINNTHDHEFSDHNHTATDIDFFITNQLKTGAVAVEKNSFHSHVWTSTETSGTLAESAPNTTFSDNRPPYVEVLFIRYTGTCDFYPSPNVEKSCSDNCTYPNDTDFDGGNLSLFGEGVVTIESKLINIDLFIKENTCRVIKETGIGEVEVI